MNLSLQHKLSYWTFKIVSLPLRYMSYGAINRVSKALGTLIFYCSRQFRKRTMNNLAVAKSLAMDEKRMFDVAKKSMQNSMRVLLEYFRLKGSKGNLEEIAVEDNPEVVDESLRAGRGLIIFTGHQSNWEILFLLLSSRLSGACIGRPIANKLLYEFILSVREIYGGRVIAPKKAIPACVKELKQGNFVAIAGDQGMPNSSYSYPFLGTRAWNTTSPALLSYKTGAPIIVSTVRFEGGKYHMHHEKPIFPNLDTSLKLEVTRLMDIVMGYFENVVSTYPEQWLWQHRRWKQQPVNNIKKHYRYDFILIILPENASDFYDTLKALREIYPRGFFTILSSGPLEYSDAKIIRYDNTINEVLLRDWSFQLVFDFTDSPVVKKHYLKLGAWYVFGSECAKNIPQLLLKPGSAP